jgi:hypothetical protein
MSAAAPAQQSSSSSSSSSENKNNSNTGASFVKSFDALIDHSFRVESTPWRCVPCAESVDSKDGSLLFADKTYVPCEHGVAVTKISSEDGTESEAALAFCVRVTAGPGLKTIPVSDFDKTVRFAAAGADSNEAKAKGGAKPNPALACLQLFANPGGLRDVIAHRIFALGWSELLRTFRPYMRKYRRPNDSRTVDKLCKSDFVYVALAGEGRVVIINSHLFYVHLLFALAAADAQFPADVPDRKFDLFGLPTGTMQAVQKALAMNCRLRETLEGDASRDAVIWTSPSAGSSQAPPKASEVSDSVCEALLAISLLLMWKDEKATGDALPVGAMWQFKPIPTPVEIFSDSRPANASKRWPLLVDFEEKAGTGEMVRVQIPPKMISGAHVNAAVLELRFETWKARLLIMTQIPRYTKPESFAESIGSFVDRVLLPSVPSANRSNTALYAAERIFNSVVTRATKSKSEVPLATPTYSVVLSGLLAFIKKSAEDDPRVSPEQKAAFSKLYVKVDSAFQLVERLEQPNRSQVEELSSKSNREVIDVTGEPGPTDAAPSAAAATATATATAATVSTPAPSSSSSAVSASSASQKKRPREELEAPIESKEQADEKYPTKQKPSDKSGAKTNGLAESTAAPMALAQYSSSASALSSSSSSSSSSAAATAAVEAVAQTAVAVPMSISPDTSDAAAIAPKQKTPVVAPSAPPKRLPPRKQLATMAARKSAPGISEVIPATPPVAQHAPITFDWEVEDDDEFALPDEECEDTDKDIDRKIAFYQAQRVSTENEIARLEESIQSTGEAMTTESTFDQRASNDQDENASSKSAAEAKLSHLNTVIRVLESIPRGDDGAAAPKRRRTEEFDTLEYKIKLIAEAVNDVNNSVKAVAASNEAAMAEAKAAAAGVQVAVNKKFDDLTQRMMGFFTGLDDLARQELSKPFTLNIPAMSLPMQLAPRPASASSSSSSSASSAAHVSS